MADVVLCYRCKERPIPPCNLKHEHYRCYRCHAEQYREKRAKSDKKYNAKPESLERHRQRERVYNKRRVMVAGHRITMPTETLKQQAAVLISRRRDELVRGQQSRAKAEGYS